MAGGVDVCLGARTASVSRAPTCLMLLVLPPKMRLVSEFSCLVNLKPTSLGWPASLLGFFLHSVYGYLFVSQQLYLIPFCKQWWNEYNFNFSIFTTFYYFAMKFSCWIYFFINVTFVSLICHNYLIYYTCRISFANRWWDEKIHAYSLPLLPFPYQLSLHILFVHLYSLLYSFQIILILW